MRSVGLLLLAALPAFARGSNDKPVFDVPEAQRPKSDEPAHDETPLETTLRRLAGWPSDRARAAAERLIVQKERSLPLVLEVLVSQRPEDQPLKPGAAYVIGRIGDPSHFLTLILVAAEKAQQRHAATFLEAAHRLKPDEAVAEAFRFFHLSETTLRREATDFVRDHIRKANTEAVLDLLDTRKAERPFTREIGLMLLDRLVQTGEVPWPEAGPHFYRALGDESPQVASRAMRLVASSADEANIAALNDLITKKYSHWRQRSYAALALSILSSAFKVQPFSPESIGVLEGDRGLRHKGEPLARASAALALAQAALRSRDKELVRLLDRQIPIVLIDAVGAGSRHYRDFGSVMPLAYSMLRRITGQNFPDHAPDWAQWWQDNARNFRARRELVEVDPADFEAVVVDWTAPRARGAATRRLAVVGPTRPTYLHGRAYAVPKEEVARAVDALRTAGFFEAAEADPRQAGEEDAIVVVRVGDLVRTVAFGEADPKTRDRVLGELDVLADEYGWQLWWDLERHPSWELFFGENSKWFHEHKDPAERAARHRAMIAASLNDMIAVEDRLHAAQFVAGLPGGAGALDETQATAFVEAVAAEREANDFVAAVVDMLVPERGETTALALVDAIAGKIGPSTHGLLVHLCGALPPARVAELAKDPRWKVRRGAVSAIAALDPAIARPVLAERVEDLEVLVRVTAVEALARMGDRQVLPALEKLARDRSTEVRGAAAYAYGLLAGEEGRAGVTPLLLEDPSSDVKIRAVDGLVEGKDPGAPDLLVACLAREADIRVRSAAAGGVVALETPELVQRLMGRLEVTSPQSPERVALVNILSRFRSGQTRDMLRAVLNGDDPLSRDAAALGLARQWDDAAVTQLIRMAKEKRNALAAVRHLQILSSREFEVESYEEQADNYAAWYQANATGRPILWFLEALTQRGYDTASLAGIADEPAVTPPPPPDAAIPVLLRALRDKDWYVQRNAAFLLNLRLGDAAPEPVTYLSSTEDVEKAIRGYNDWWKAIQERKRAEERG